MLHIKNIIKKKEKTAPLCEDQSQEVKNDYRDFKKKIFLSFPCPASN